ncbi:hypothetical protein BC940DRAFT_320028 [Gongronella butleri]|nr:hypothetical protein BC940DRAFT_320028 [Gongronella butleri]
MIPALRPAARLATRATQRRWASTEQTSTQQTEESFSTNAWRNALIVAVGAVVWYRIDERLTDQGEEKHPFTKWIEYNLLSNSSDNDRFAAEQLEKAHKIADYKAFERSSPRALTAGANCDVTNVQIRTNYE